ncbi:MAG: chemotaxis protein CheA, partial [Candidatus Hydrogenedentes bacterium]|nr:chemotaxis protein CheA [Candidatus Hydrogenedentota bacterium]
MVNKGIENTIDALSEGFVLADPSNLQRLADFHTEFEEISQWAEESSQSEVAAAAKVASELIEQVILAEVPDSQCAIDTVGCILSSLQSIICHGRDVNETDISEYQDISVVLRSIEAGARDTDSEKSAAPMILSDADSDDGQTCSSATETDPTVSNNNSTILTGDPELLGDFVVEAMEHLEEADVHLLTIETEPENSEALNAVFRAFHTIKGVAGFLALDDIGSLAHEAENLLDRARKGELVLAGAAIDVTFDAVDALKNLVTIVRGCLSNGEPMPKDPSLPDLLSRIKDVSNGQVPNNPLHVAVEPGKKVGEILVERCAVTKENVEAALDEQKKADEPPKLGEQLVRDGKASAKDVAQALRSQKSGTDRQMTKVKNTVKVDADRLDQLVDTIGEMVIAESMVSQSPELDNVISQQFIRRVTHLDKITRELQEMAMSLRMIPVRGTFQRMARLVRDLAKKGGKQVKFVMAGEDTELDKTVVDHIGDPLVHMVRNAVDHGIENSVDERVAAGKSPVGRIELRAFHKGGNIYIEIEDDGQGLDRDAILAKAQERGLIKESDSLSDRDVYNLIFEPGFSTAKVVTEVSGRGVGMDVVRRNIEALRGQVEITSTPGKGSVFSIRLPLTLAIIDGMVVRVGSERYIIPTLSIMRSVRPEPGSVSTVLECGEMLKLQGELIPLCRLDRLFGIENAQQDLTRALVVIVESDATRMGLVVDELLGQQQIVIKSLGESMQGLAGIAGSAIMPDGRVSLI